MSTQSSPNRSIKFARQNDFRNELKSRVADYFERTGLDERDQLAMFIKTITIFTWFIGSYCILVFAPVPFWAKILAAISAGFAGAGVGFSIMHDAGHGAYSKKTWVNKLVFFSLDFMGGSSYLWNVKHNILHHTYSNIEGHDDDIDMGILGRLAPEQEHLPFHRYQHFYIWFLYGMMTLKWHYFDDFNTLRKGYIGAKKIPPMKKKDVAVFLFGKSLFLSYALIIPLFFFHIGWVFAFYLLATFVQGVTMATVFQLAHCLEESEFPQPSEDLKMDHDWATHQVLTTVDFAPRNWLVNWYVGGLNFQIEHHLFPRISHIHYPALAQIVRETCEDFGLPYRVKPTLRSGIRSHFRWLRRMGRAEQAATTSTPAVSA